MVRATFEAIAAQCPLLLPHVAGVSASFASIVAARIALPKSFALAEDFRPIAPEIRRLMATLSECWADRAALEQFLVCTFWLPTLVGAIFGFRKHFMLIDHIDLADAMIGHAPPFDEAPTNAFVIEIVLASPQNRSSSAARRFAQSAECSRSSPKPPGSNSPTGSPSCRRSTSYPRRTRP
jgi:hypothetical protein